jgi:hypothetical protein
MPQDTIVEVFMNTFSRFCNNTLNTKAAETIEGDSLSEVQVEQECTKSSICDVYCYPSLSSLCRHRLLACSVVAAHLAL